MDEAYESAAIFDPGFDFGNQSFVHDRCVRVDDQLVGIDIAVAEIELGDAVAREFGEQVGGESEDSGREDERGVGNIVNAPLSPGDGSYAFRELWDGALLPRLAAFRPQLLLISAGFDAHRDDPLADIRLGSEDYAWITERLVDVAQAHANGRVVSSLEGGYHLGALAASASAHVAALADF